MHVEAYLPTSKTKCMKTRLWMAVAVLLGCIGCQRSSSSSEKPLLPAHFEAQGHRGARGLLPENTVPAFLKALDYGMTTLELDVVVTKDGALVVSHEPWMNATICTQPNGDTIPHQQERGHNIFAMTLAEVQAYDCGHRPHPRFPEQQRMQAQKPTLREVVKAVRAHLKSASKPMVLWNIETKSVEGQDAIFHPAPQDFAQLLYDELQRLEILDVVTVQSFDPRTLEAMHRLDSTVTLSLLIEETAAPDLTRYLSLLSFVPDVLSINHEAVTPDLVAAAHDYNLRLIPWTVNAPEDMRRLIDWGVDGLISDYPDRLSAVVKAYTMQ